MVIRLQVWSLSFLWAPYTSNWVTPQRVLFEAEKTEKLRNAVGIWFCNRYFTFLTRTDTGNEIHSIFDGFCQYDSFFILLIGSVEFHKTNELSKYDRHFMSLPIRLQRNILYYVSISGSIQCGWESNTTKCYANMRFGVCCEKKKSNSCLVPTLIDCLVDLEKIEYFDEYLSLVVEFSRKFPWISLWWHTISVQIFEIRFFLF